MLQHEATGTGPLAAIEKRAGDYCISIKDAAKLADCSSRTLWREIQRGKLASVKFSENRTRILASELARYMGGES
jgi:predicted site-specific integrase-resolvase